MSDFQHILKANGVLIECDSNTLIHLVSGGSSPNVLSDYSETVKYNDVGYREVKREDPSCATAIIEYAVELWTEDPDLSVASVKRSVKDAYGVLISDGALRPVRHG